MKEARCFWGGVRGLILAMGFTTFALTGEDSSGQPGSSPAGQSSGQDLARSFLNPPRSAGPSAYWAWMNGVVDLPQLTRELEEFKEKGLSGVYIFDVGARDPAGVVPEGPSFLGPESMKAIGHAIREATRLGLEVGILTSSSWNSGGPWIEPRHASMGLYHSQISAKGPARFSQVLPFPAVPENIPRRPDGLPAYFRDVAVLAVPRFRELPGHEFLFELAPPGIHTVDRVVLYNTQSDDAKRYGSLHLFAKDFAVEVSATTQESSAFREIVRGSLEPRVGPQEFRFDPTPARFVKLWILAGHNSRHDRVQLGEFEMMSVEGKNVAALYHSDGSRTGAKLLRFSSALGREGDWSAGNIHDGAKSGAHGSWSSEGSPQPVIPDVHSIVDGTDHLDGEGRLTWNVPPGEWTVLRYVCANTGQKLAIPSPNSQGLSIDHFNPEATRMHIQYILDKLRGELTSFENTTLRYLYSASYELRGSTWTPRFLEEFKSRCGYDMTLYLPVLTGMKLESEEASEAFRHDFRKVLGDLLVDAYYRTARELANRHGLLLVAEAGGPGPPLHQVPVDALKALGSLDIPRGEFWKEHNVWVVKETACAAHVYGQRIVQMEAFTSFRHWQDGPFDLKPIADRAFCGGANHFVFHTSPHTPPQAGRPGWVYHAGTHMGPSLVWWPQAKPFIDYLARCSSLLQQGLFVADVLYYYGDQGFNFVPPKHVDPSLGPGYDYDVTNAEVLLTRAKVRDGRIVLPDGMSYELLVIPDREDMNLEVLEKLVELIRDGATVVGRKPARSSGLREHPQRGERVRQLANRLWGPCDGKKIQENSFGKGKIIWGRSLREILRDRGIGPDFTYAGQREGTQLDFIHRRGSRGDLYFLWNQNARWEEVACVFRISGRVPELWSPVTGEMRNLGIYQSVPGGTRLRLRFPPSGSTFVVFRNPTGEDHLISLQKSGGRGIPDSAGIPPDFPPVEVLRGEGKGELELMAFQEGSYSLKTAQGKEISLSVAEIPAAREISGPWEVRFPEGWGAPARKIFPRLVSWTEDPQDGIKYFSGIATYSKEFDLSPEILGRDRVVFLDLGRLWAVADVTLNGAHLGVCWCPPFRLEITRALRPGRNRLEVEVANTWSNRLAGDARLPGEKRYCRTNITFARDFRISWKEAPLLESGLLGPVKLIFADRMNVKLPQ